ncbi:MAG: glutaredoxin family protein [Aquabacterium sp.]
MPRFTESRRSLLGLVVLVLAVSLGSQWWGHWQEQRLGREIARLAATGDIVMISSDTCGFCDMARLWMKEHQVAFSECSVERDEACRQRQQLSLLQVTPVILVRGQAQAGFNPKRIHDRLAAG